MNNELKNEVQSANLTPQPITMETEPNSVSSTTKDYTPDKVQNQATSNNSSKPKPNFFDSLGHFKHNVFAEFADIVRFNGINHIYRDSTSGIYVCDNELIQFALQKYVPKFNFSKAKEEVQQLNIATKMSERTESPSNFVGLNNGIYNIETSEFKKFQDCTPTEFILTNKLSVDYAEQIPTSNDVVDNLFKEITSSDVGLELFLYEVMGACFCRCSLPLAFVLTGNSSTDGNDGRSIFLDIIKSIAGECASFESLQALITAKSFHSLYTKTCNISNEQYRTKMLNINKLVGLISGNKVLPTKEFGGLNFKPYTTLLFNVRNVIDFEDVFSNLNGFFKIIPFNNQLNWDKSMTNNLLTMENLQYITMKALRAFYNVIPSGKFSVPAIVEQATSNYLLDNNSAREFCIANPIFHVEGKAYYYKQYDDWCRDNNKVPLSNSQFGKEVIKLGYLPARYSIGMGSKRNNYYIVKDFNVHKLIEDYKDIIEEHSIDAIETIFSSGICVEGRFIEAFIDFFHRNTLEDMHDKVLTERADVNERIEKAVQDLPVTIIS